ncbi:MAG: glutaredoxin [Gammaproteobacteria bacterium]|nr:glutaredoxin [Gammaproteobacteria bacterium]
MKIKKLALYMRHGCFFCSRVMSVIESLNIEVEMRNIWDDSEYEKQLITATNRSVVPVLYYEDENQNANWLPESSDIVTFLNQEYR